MAQRKQTSETESDTVSDAFNVRKKKTGVYVIVPKADLGADIMPGFKRCFETLLREGHAKLVLNLKKPRFISSATIGILLIKRREAQKHGGDLRLACPSSDIRQTIKMMGLGTIFQTFPSEKEAVGSYADA